MSSIYFGNATKQTWIKAPKTGMKGSAPNWSAQGTLLSGRGYLKRSAASHRRFEMSWLGSMNEPDIERSLQTIKDYYDGLYGDGPFFWNDPYATTSNILPPNWAAPMLTQADWSELATGLTPTYTTATVANNYPSKYATFTTSGAYASENKLTLIIPTGHRLHFGWHGISTGSTTGVRIVPYKRSDGTADTALNPVKITAGGSVRTNTQVNGATYSRVEIFIASSATATINITGMIAQILPEGVSVAAGGFISGRGNTGIEFASPVDIEYYSSAINNGQIGMSATFIEV